MKITNKIGFWSALLACTTLLGACGQADQQSDSDTTLAIDNPRSINNNIAELTVTNPSDFSRNAQPVYVSFYDLGLSSVLSSSSQFTVKNSDETLAAQTIDSDYDGKLDSLLFLTDLTSGQAKSYQINYAEKSNSNNRFQKLTQAEISHKVGGEWVAHTKPPSHKPANEFKEYIGGHFENVTELTPPAYYTDHSNWIRYEGPGIESDKVGYRIYLDWRNGFDIFGKTTSKPALQNVGVDGYESYHHRQPWGMDILKVGSSLGAGGFGLWHDNQLSLVNNVENWQAIITANGDLYSAIQINYSQWKNAVNTQDISANISMQGGSRLAKVNVNLTKDLPTMAIGVVKHPETEFIQGNVNITGEAYSYIASWGKQSLNNDYLGMAVFFKSNQLKEITQDTNNYLAVLTPKGQTHQQAIDYYFAAVWQPESGIETKEAFISYLNEEAEKLTIPARINLQTQLSNQAKAAPLTAEAALAWSIKLADSELARKTLGYNVSGWDVNRQRLPKFEYDIIGLQPMAYQWLGEITGEDKYLSVIEKVTGSYVNDKGEISRYKLANFNIDSVSPGVNLLTLHQRTGEEKYRIAADTLRKQLAEQPKTSEGAFWHKAKYPGQLWLDGVYMGMPFLAEYAALYETGDTLTHSLDEVVNEFVLTRKYLRDVKSGLYYHAWDELKQQEWANKETGLSPEFWARGMGWLTMAIVDVLDYIPQEYTEQRQVLIDITQEIAADLVKVQDEEYGTWWQVLDKPNQLGNYRESSATAMFTYFLVKSINKGYISKDYQSAAIKAYQGMLNEFVLVHNNGEISMTQQCYVAGLGFGRDGSYKYYMTEPIWQNDPKGNGPFMLAGIEVYKLLKT